MSWGTHYPCTLSSLLWIVQYQSNLKAVIVESFNWWLRNRETTLYLLLQYRPPNRTVIISQPFWESCMRWSNTEPKCQLPLISNHALNFCNRIMKKFLTFSNIYLWCCFWRPNNRLCFILIRKLQKKHKEPILVWHYFSVSLNLKPNGIDTENSHCICLCGCFSSSNAF